MYQLSTNINKVEILLPDQSYRHYYKLNTARMTITEKYITLVVEKTFDDPLRNQNKMSDFISILLSNVNKNIFLRN